MKQLYIVRQLITAVLFGKSLLPFNRKFFIFPLSLR